MRIDIWSDLVCPWCYIGKRRLEQALAVDGLEDDAEIVWHSFQLDPSAVPGEDLDLAAHLGAKYGGGREYGLQALAHVTTVAAEAGLEYHLDTAHRTNTLDAHRLLHLARALVATGDLPADGQGRLKEALLKAYFTDSEHLGDAGTMTRIAVANGLPEDRVRTLLAGTGLTAEVEADQAQAVAYGATGVPFFVIDERYGVSGAQPVEVFTEALRRARADKTVTVVGADADGACGPDGCPV